MAFMKQGADRGVFGKHGERPPLVLEIGDHQPVVWEHALNVRGELLQEPLGIELFLQGTPDRPQGAEQARKTPFGRVLRGGRFVRAFLVNLVRLYHRAGPMPGKVMATVVRGDGV